MRIILFGSPGSGKGTQAVILSERLNLKRISLGDILREEVKKDSSIGREVKNYMEKGLLVPDEVVSRVIEENIDSKNFILDGYPRNLNQAENLDKILNKKGQKIDYFINLNVDEKTIVDRLSKRRVCKKCGANYHVDNLPPKKEGVCDLCKGELMQRKDDNPEVIKKRWEVFLKESQQVLDFYEEKGKFLKIDARGDKEEIFEVIKENIK